jgi:N-dimethylarginine dimethylaminohydrolase
MDHSEFNVPPARFVMHHPSHGGALNGLAEKDLTEVNFLSMPNRLVLGREYDAFVDVLRQHSNVTFLQNILTDDSDFQKDSEGNPNLMFCRDSAVTLPWNPQHFIPARLVLAGRKNEGGIMSKALSKLGLEPLLTFDDDEYLEGGDVLPVMQDGKRVLLIGFGNRTTKAAAMKIAMKLIPDHVDQVIGLSHDPDLLHLDTGFTVLPNQVMFAAAGMFHSGFMFDSDRRLHDVDPISTAQKLGFRIITCEKLDAIHNERCNMLPLGNGKFMAFDMPEKISSELEEAAGISILSIEGQELAKAAGGVHCLTRPVYL